jgi:hypothetical protein
LETNLIVVNDDECDFELINDELDDDNEESLVGFDANEPEINVDEAFNVSQWRDKQ